MFETIANTVGNILVSNGVKTLGNTVKNTTEKGLEKVNDLVKNATGIEILNKDTIDNLTPEQYLELQRLEQAHASEINNLAIEYAKVSAEDTADARKMHEIIVTNSNNGWFVQNFIYLFAIFWSVFAAGYIMLITFTDIPPENQRFADTILGFMLGTVVASILQFFFGSSLKLPTSTTTTKTTSK